MSKIRDELLVGITNWTMEIQPENKLLKDIEVGIKQT